MQFSKLCQFLLKNRKVIQIFMVLGFHHVFYTGDQRKQSKISKKSNSFYFIIRSWMSYFVHIPNSHQFISNNKKVIKYSWFYGFVTFFILEIHENVAKISRKINIFLLHIKKLNVIIRAIFKVMSISLEKQKSYSNFHGCRVSSRFFI